MHDLEKQHDEHQLGLCLDDNSGAAPISPMVVRKQLNELIEQVKSAQHAMPWDEATERQLQFSFPKLAKSLPPEEAVFLSRCFEFELERAKRRVA